MTTAQVVETSVTVNNSPIQRYVFLEDRAQPTSELTPEFKPFTIKINVFKLSSSTLRRPASR